MGLPVTTCPPRSLASLSSCGTLGAVQQNCAARDRGKPRPPKNRREEKLRSYSCLQKYLSLVKESHSTFLGLKLANGFTKQGPFGRSPVVELGTRLANARGQRFAA
jgi:hypothetical protein